MNSNTWTHQCRPTSKKFTFTNCVRMLGAALKTYYERWLVGMDGDRDSRESMLSTGLDDNDDSRSVLYLTSLKVLVVRH